LKVIRLYWFSMQTKTTAPSAKKCWTS
jgi:hypothetical protein